MFVHYSFLSATTQAISDERGFGSFRFIADLDNNEQKAIVMERSLSRTTS